MPKTSNQSDTLAGDLIALFTTKYIEKRYDEALDCAVLIRMITKSDEGGSRGDAALACINDCSGILLGKKDKPHEKRDALEQSCSFCSQKPPSVKLGAGPSVFICNECTEIFSSLFKEEQRT
jgi:ClpX C4-type zinc finger